jgi:hypothetical protein
MEGALLCASPSITLPGRLGSKEKVRRKVRRDITRPFRYKQLSM